MKQVSIFFFLQLMKNVTQKLKYAGVGDQMIFVTPLSVCVLYPPLIQQTLNHFTSNDDDGAWHTGTL